MKLAPNTEKRGGGTSNCCYRKTILKCLGKGLEEEGIVSQPNQHAASAGHNVFSPFFFRIRRYAGLGLDVVTA